MKTIAEQLNIKDFPFEIKDSKGNNIYYEDSNNFWCKREYDEQGNQIYYENSYGKIVNNREEIIEVNGVKYKRIC